MIKLYWKLGWRNLFRNKRRSLIAGTAIGLGLASLIFTDGMMQGMNANMIQSGTATFLGEAQIHQKNYRESPEVDETIDKPKVLMDSLMKNPIVRALAPRVMSDAMLKPLKWWALIRHWSGNYPKSMKPFPKANTLIARIASRS